MLRNKPVFDLSLFSLEDWEIYGALGIRVCQGLKDTVGEMKNSNQK